MAQTFEKIPDELIPWIEAQPVFFVATAPADQATHLNVSPRGLDTFRVLDANRVAWLDLTGSGVETIAHLRADGRITLMFCAFDDPPRIVRLYGRGAVHEPKDEAHDALRSHLPDLPRGEGYHRRRGGPGVELVRVRGAAHGPCGSPRAARRIGPAQGEGEDGRLPGAQERQEHRRSAGPGAHPRTGGRRERSKRGLDVTGGG
jgi:hypothetical protein